MSGTAVVARVGLDDRGFQEGVQKIQRSLKVVQSEFAAASSKLGDFGKTTEGMRLKADSLNRQMEIQRTKVDSIKRAYEESVATKGEDAKARENLKIRLNYAITEMNNMENELNDLNDQIRIQSNSPSRFQFIATASGIRARVLPAGLPFSPKRLLRIQKQQTGITCLHSIQRTSF